MELPEIGPDERTPPVEALLGVIRQWKNRGAELERSHQGLRDENARLKGQKDRPDPPPSQRPRADHSLHGSGVSRRHQLDVPMFRGGVA